jgi:hypothetical protein
VAGSLTIDEDVVWCADGLVAQSVLYSDAFCGDVNNDASVRLKPVWIPNPYTVSYRETSCGDGLRLGWDPRRPCRCWDTVVAPTQLS